MCPGSDSMTTTSQGAADTLSLSEFITHKLPSTPLCIAALQFAKDKLETPIFNHSLRVFLYADEHVKTSVAVDREMLFVASLFHDIGTSDSCNGPQRFEVEGADAAASFLRDYSIPEATIREVWLSIALHSSHTIAERAGTLPYLIRTAVLLDFVEGKRVELNALSLQNELETHLPRLAVERALANAVVRQALERPLLKAPRPSWPRQLLDAHMADPRWDRDNPGF